jgi:hypothetical protein
MIRDDCLVVESSSLSKRSGWSSLLRRSMFHCTSFGMLAGINLMKRWKETHWQELNEENQHQHQVYQIP